MLPGRPRNDDRLIVEALVYILLTGCPCGDLTIHFGPWISVYTRWYLWAYSGLGATFLDVLGQDAKGSLPHLNSSDVKVHPEAANPARGQENQCLGRIKRGVNWNITALVEANGRAVQLALLLDNATI